MYKNIVKTKIYKDSTLVIDKTDDSNKFMVYTDYSALAISVIIPIGSDHRDNFQCIELCLFNRIDADNWECCAQTNNAEIPSMVFTREQAMNVSKNLADHLSKVLHSQGKIMLDFKLWDILWCHKDNIDCDTTSP